MYCQKKRCFTCVFCLASLLKKYTRDTPDTATQIVVAECGCDPFLILVSCILSLRTRDVVTIEASRQLFSHFRTPNDFLRAELSFIENLIKSVGFYRRKALQLKKLSKQLIECFNGKVPSTERELLSLSGVGRKTANLVLGVAFNIPALCVDTHVHRLANQWGLVKTITPEETEYALKKIIPKELWINFNEYMVRWGQSKCKPNARECSCLLLKVVCKKQKKITRT